MMTTPHNEIVFVDSNLTDYQTLLNGIPADAEVHIIDNSHDGLQQMLAFLTGHTNIEAIHVLGHGNNGELKLGNLTLTNQNIEQYKAQLDQLGQKLTTDGDLLFYGCNVAQGNQGQMFVKQIADFTHADVAASDDLTGATRLGGNWVLENHTGNIETTLPFNEVQLQSYDYSLVATPTLVTKTYTQQSSDTGIVLLDGTPVVGGSTFGAFSDSGGSWITFQNINASTGITLKVKDSNGSWTTVNTTTQWADNSPYDTVAAYAGALAGIGVDYAVEVDFSQQVEGSHTITWEARTSTGNYDSDYTVTINVPDTTPPVFQSAASNVEGTKVILTYDGTLNATTAAAETFFVSVGGGVNAVTAVTVNGSNVELTLTTAITNGQAITVAYTDPTTGNDANAIQ
ncbi:MAG: DUF4347 domain-containing protein, partial [Methylococcales bacterium]|nr:DUF4347 domain-containing protein [Methylococcales bacterium]